MKNHSFLISEKNGNGRYIDKRVEAKVTIYPTTENYKEINKTFKLDNIDFKVLSLVDFNFGTLMPGFVGNISESEGNQIAERYYVRVKSGNLNQMYSLDKLIGFLEGPIKSYSKIDKSYNKDFEYLSFI
ncbi:hypothetical protein ACSXDL_02110 [Clostridium perfringens]|uniref:hypothetical protein n=1 Tax=Clostridium perfringens TaxID=1502 RepID=UPI003F44194E